MSSLQRQPQGQLKTAAPVLPFKPLLHILDRGEMPGDMVKKPKQIALRGQTDVYITRAEIELKKAMQSLAFVTQSEINSIYTLTALSLPPSVAPLFWTINAFLQEKYSRPNDNSFIQHRNHDARLLFQQLAKLDLLPWSAQLVESLRPEELPDNLLFPLGHPIVGHTYRRHPFKSRRNHYYPVTDYFSMLLKEREQALLRVLTQLGATKIVMTPIPATGDLDCQSSLAAQLHQTVFSYPPRMEALPAQLDFQQHPWLVGEPTWRAIAHQRLTSGALFAQFEFNMDVMGLLSSQIKRIAQLVSGLDSMRLPDNYSDLMLSKILKTRQVKVDFWAMPMPKESSIQSNA